MTSSWPTLSPGGFGRCRRGSEQMTFHVPSSKPVKYQAFRASRSTRSRVRAPEMSDRLPRSSNLLVLQEDPHYSGGPEAYRSDSCVGRGLKSRQVCLIDPSAAPPPAAPPRAAPPLRRRFEQPLLRVYLMAAGTLPSGRCSQCWKRWRRSAVVKSSTPTLRRTLWRSGTDHWCRIHHDGEAGGSVPLRWLPDGPKHARQAWRRVA